MIDHVQVPGFGKRILKESGLVSMLRGLNARSNRSARKAVKINQKDISIGADKKLHQMLTNFFSENSSYPILSEEGKDQLDFAKQKGRLWIIDPLDGSINFSRELPIHCISIALWENRKPLFGMIYDFHRDELFEAQATKGAYLNGSPIRVSQTRKPQDGILSTGFPSWRSYDSKSLTQFISQVQNWKKIRMIGSAATSLAWIACGRMDAYIEEDVRIWDVAAGLALVQEAGGKIVCRSRERANFVTALATNSRLMKNFKV
jgi:myo-inositol-1(or 4)-monophosphatase